ncbi:MULTISPECIES: DUF3964 family protein [Bacillus cereus group]|uniref:DUF3964 family protein n=1 Tax=Bacillus cereus group TaxID=86661 RepID=UPI0005A33D03|nr:MULTISPECIES: DUF3964 family protein [Bacillus cereus group]HDR7532354.1 DUF3964 family protein [Bacillus anthracis]AJH84232.1 hypothetical protein BF36_3292 [Bacillus thuringiensis]KAA0750932.1 DUF3964 domain-containing protein [Bacillus sp. AY1-10]MCU5694569.1 DUF3964 family protein [Bacillus cereus]QKE06795.1 DUF3964 family protein [Bacillus cereus]
MTTRQERILQLPFFENKRELAEQVLKMEREEHIYLPDQFEIKQVPPYSFGEKQTIIGRIHEFYFVSVGSEGEWKYQLFKDEMKCREFFITLSGITDQQIAFWFNNIELLKSS